MEFIRCASPILEILEPGQSVRQVLTKFWGLLNSSGERVVRIIVSASNDVRCHLESYTPRVGCRYSRLNHFLLSTLLTLSTYMASQLVNTLTNFLHHQMMPSQEP